MTPMLGDRMNFFLSVVLQSLFSHISSEFSSIVCDAVWKDDASGARRPFAEEVLNYFGYTISIATEKE